MEGGERTEPRLGPSLSVVGWGLLGFVEGGGEGCIPNHHTSTPLTAGSSSTHLFGVAGGPLGGGCGSDPFGTSGASSDLRERLEEPVGEEPCGGIPPKEPSGV